MKNVQEITKIFCNRGVYVAEWYRFHYLYNVVVKIYDNPDRKVHGANKGPIWSRQDHVAATATSLHFPSNLVFGDGS